MEFFIIVHGDFRKRFVDEGLEIPKGVQYVWGKDVFKDDLSKYHVLCEIFDGASNIDFISEKTASLEEAVVDDDWCWRDYKTNKGYNFTVSYEQAYRGTYCDVDSCSEEFFNEIIFAVCEYYKVRFEYHEIHKYDANLVGIHLYENEQAKEDELSKKSSE